jgi:hypothetical protein
MEIAWLLFYNFTMNAMIKCQKLVVQMPDVKDFTHLSDPDFRGVFDIINIDMDVAS